MFKANITKIYVDGEKQRDSKVRGGKIEDVFPGSNLRFKIELENLYDSGTDIVVKDISITGLIEEIDNGGDIEEEINEFDLNADIKTSKELEFSIPLEVEAKDRLLTIEITANDDAGIKYDKEFTYDLEIAKEEHQIRILKAELDKETYKCGENALLDLSVTNIGAKSEDVKLKIENRDLSLNINKEFSLGNDPFEPSSTYQDKINLFLPINIDVKTYPITITTEYGTKKETTRIDVAVNECEKTESSEETQETKETTQTQKPSIEKKTEAQNNTQEPITSQMTISGNLFPILAGLLLLLILLISVLGAKLISMKK